MNKHIVDLLSLLLPIILIFGLTKFEYGNYLNLITMLFILIPLFIVAFSAWQKRKIATKKEKHFSFMMILSFSLTIVMLLGIYIPYSYSFFTGIVSALLGISIIVGWNLYMRRNPDLSGQEGYQIYFIGLLFVFLGYINFSSSNDSAFQTAVMVLGLIAIVIYVFYTLFTLTKQN